MQLIIIYGTKQLALASQLNRLASLRTTPGASFNCLVERRRDLDSVSENGLIDRCQFEADARDSIIENSRDTIRPLLKPHKYTSK